jgi:hypothetical protein
MGRASNGKPDRPDQNQGLNVNIYQAEQLLLWIISHNIPCELIRRTGRRQEAYAVSITSVWWRAEDDGSIEYGEDVCCALNGRGAREILGY